MFLTQPIDSDSILLTSIAAAYLIVLTLLYWAATSRNCSLFCLFWGILNPIVGLIALIFILRLPIHPKSAASNSIKFAGRDYFNQEWNFGITIPKSWNIFFENEGGHPWMQPLRIAGPKASRGQPFLSVLVTVAQEDGKGLQAYMEKAEKDLRGGFVGFALDAKQETSLLGFPVAWMTYGYRIDSGQRKEINATAFFGHGRQMLFQFICETDSDCERKDFPLFERIINSLRVGSAGIRHPSMTLLGSNECELCHKSLSDGGSHSMFNLKLGRLTLLCNKCRNAPENASNPLEDAAKLARQQPKEEASKRTIADDVFTFNDVRELISALEKKLLPNVERATRTDINACYITAQIQGKNVNETDLSTFQNGLFRMIQAIATDFPVHQWKAKVNSRMTHLTAISKGQLYCVATFLIDENGRAYGF